jgi:murein DD-endopeptidase MepM/ murein hydrolase activator NlpD
MNVALVLLLAGNDKTLRVCVLLTAIIALLPLLVVVTMTQVGAAVVSDILLPQVANRNPTTIPTFRGTIQLSQPAIWPVTHGVITQEFGHPNPPFQVAHTGLDIASFEGDRVRAILPGTVTFAGVAPVTNNIEVHVAYGQGLEVWYAHLLQTAVTVHSQVSEGQLLGYEGHTGWATGTHVHLEVQLYHIPVNPRALVGMGLPRPANTQ